MSENDEREYCDCRGRQSRLVCMCFVIIQKWLRSQNEMKMNKTLLEMELL